MERVPNSTQALDIADVFQEQADNIRIKRSVRISLNDFAQDVSLAAICETLASILSSHNPPLQLERISAYENSIFELPAQFWFLCGPSLRTLDLHDNYLMAFPDLLATSCPNLENLDLSGNSISQIPETALSPFRRLRYLSLKGNKITRLPSILGEMLSLETLLVSENPLIFPSSETVNALPGGTNELKAFLVSNSMPSDTPFSSQLDPHVQARQRPGIPSTPSQARTRSLSDTRSRSSKASRRMGLIINSKQATPDKSGVSSGSDVNTPSKPTRKLSLPERGKVEFEIPNIDIRDHCISPESMPAASTNTATTASESTTRSASGSPPKSSSVPPSSMSDSVSRAANPGSGKVHEQGLDELAESDQKPAAYFRRLSVLKESPSDDGEKGEPLRKLDEDKYFLKQPPPIKAEISPSKPALAKRKTSNASQTQLSAQSSQSSQSQSSQASHSQPSQTSQSQSSQTSHSQSSQTSQSQSSQTSQSSSSRRTTPHEKSVIVKVSRKILFSFSELHLSIKRFAGFCGDKRLSQKIVRLIHSSKEHIDDLVGAMEAVEAGEQNHTLVVNSLHACISSFKTILTTVSENFAPLVARIDACFIRMVLLTLFGSLNELQNAHVLLTNSSNMSRAPPSISRNTSSLTSSSVDLKAKFSQALHGGMEDLSLETPSISSATEAVATLEEIDERLYQTISLATSNAQVVFSELTKTISKSAIATATTNPGQALGPVVTAKFKELTHVCMTSMEITKRLLAKLAAIREKQDSASRRSFWDDINLFLKAVIQTFSAVKDIMKDAPIFNEVRGSMANLTKTTKELTIILEASSYKAISDAVGSSPNNNMWHMSNGPPAGPGGAPVTSVPQPAQNQPASGTIPAVRTPLVAAVGAAAAQALLAQQDSQYAASNQTHGSHPLPPMNLPPSVATDTFNSGLHTAPVQSMEQYYAKNVNPFDRI